MTLQYIKLWGIKGGLAILDQGLFSGSNFIFNILLARWLSPSDYGAFSLAFAIYLFFSGFHNALILEPMSVLATSKYANKLQNYIAGQVVIHFVITALLGLIILCAGGILLFYKLTDDFLALSIIGVGIFSTLMLLVWLARRSCYIVGKPGYALAASLVYSLVLITTALAVHDQFHSVNAVVWYLLMGLASLAGSLVVYFGLSILPLYAFDANWMLLLKEQVGFGKWIILAAFLNFTATQVQLIVSAIYLGLEQAGMLRAMQNFALPMLQVLTAISTLVFPSIVSDFGQQKFEYMRKKSFRIGGVLVVFSALYLVVLFFFKTPLERLLYSGKYSQFSSIIPFMGIITLIAAIESRYSMVIRALQRPVYHAIWTGLMAIVAIFAGTYLILSLGVAGAVYSQIIVGLVSLVINIWFYLNWFVPLLRIKKTEL